MNALLQKVLDDKFATRRRLAALPFAQKIKILEQLRDRSRLLASSPLRRPSSVVRPLASDL